MAERLPHKPTLREILKFGADHLKAAIDCGVTAACLWLEDHQGATRGEASPIAATPAQDETLMTVDDLADYLRIKPQTLYDWARKGRIPCERANGEIRFRRSTIDRWLAGDLRDERIEKSSPPRSDNAVKSGRSFLRPQQSRTRSKSNGRV